MTLPGMLLAFLLATAGGLAFHLIRGGSLSRMAVYVVTSWLCFFAGHLLAQAFGWTFGRLGSLNLVPALAAMLLGLLAVSILAHPGAKPHATERVSPPDSSPD